RSDTKLPSVKSILPFPSCPVVMVSLSLTCDERCKFRGMAPGADAVTVPLVHTIWPIILSAAYAKALQLKVSAVSHNKTIHFISFCLQSIWTSLTSARIYGYL